MAHQIAKLLLEKAKTVEARREAVKAAVSMGMPINEIQAYLDWIDLVQGPITEHDPEFGDTDPPQDDESV